MRAASNRSALIDWIPAIMRIMPKPKTFQLTEMMTAASPVSALRNQTTGSSMAPRSTRSWLKRPTRRSNSQNQRSEEDARPMTTGRKTTVRVRRRKGMSGDTRSASAKPRPIKTGVMIAV